MRQDGLNPPSPAADQEKQAPTMSIILQSTVGGFSAEFIRRLPSVERAMILHGLEPSQFVISKDTAADDNLPAERERPGLISRLVRWMGQTI
jgi:hypothetical protein